MGAGPGQATRRDGRGARDGPCPGHPVEGTGGSGRRRHQRGSKAKRGRARATGGNEQGTRDPPGKQGKAPPTGGHKGGILASLNAMRPQPTRRRLRQRQRQGAKQTALRQSGPRRIGAKANRCQGEPRAKANRGPRRIAGKANFRAAGGIKGFDPLGPSYALRPSGPPLIAIFPPLSSIRPVACGVGLGGIRPAARAPNAWEAYPGALAFQPPRSELKTTKNAR
jgi:hypothetical protein